MRLQSWIPFQIYHSNVQFFMLMEILIITKIRDIHLSESLVDLQKSEDYQFIPAKAIKPSFVEPSSASSVSVKTWSGKEMQKYKIALIGLFCQLALLSCYKLNYNISDENQLESHIDQEGISKGFLPNILF